MIFSGVLSSLLPYAKTYLATDVLALILLLMLIMGNISLFRLKNLENKLLVWFIAYCAVAIVFDMLATIVDGMDEDIYKTMNVVFGSINHVLMIGVGYMLALFLNAHFFARLDKKVTILLAIPMVAVLTAVIVNLFCPFLFTFNEENNYVRMNGYYFTIALGAVYIIYALILYVYCILHDKASKYFPFYLFLIPLGIGTVLQSFMYGISMIWPCVAIGLGGIISCFKSEKVYRDELTGLYNRAFFNYIVSKHQKESDPHLSGIMLDINNFKKINDKFGHKFGDDALVDFAKQLKKSAPAGSIVIRLSGDEFVILSHTSDIERIQQAMNSINDGFSLFNDAKNNRPYEIFASMGYSIYRPGQEPEDFISAFDREMYAEKERYHQLNTNDKQK